ncbi:MAG TPA: hypothetical protein VK421_15845 [Pyrinomonadaceae bacterium]|nr:hypothetical protein [Pyrinomonadaceae bacterium]
MFRRLATQFLALAALAAAGQAALAQSGQPTPTPAPQDTAPPPIQEEKRKETQQKIARGSKDLKNPTGEQVAEFVIAIYGNSYGRAMLNQVRRTGVERGRTTRVGAENRPEEVTYEQRFIRGESFAKDKLRLDQKTPTVEYSLVYNEGKIFGIINNTPFTPRTEATTSFLAAAHHGIDALLRYKENGSTVAFVAKDKQKNIDLWIVDLTDKEGRKTRYYVSANPDVRLTARVLWLEYERPDPAGGETVKYKQTFHDYRVAQGTLVPFRSVLYANGKQIEETRIQTVTYGVKMDDSYFKNPESAAN